MRRAAPAGPKVPSACRPRGCQDGTVTITSPRWILGGCNLPLDDGRFRRPWGLAVLRVLPSSVTVRPGLTRRRWHVEFDEILQVQCIQLPLGQGIRLRTGGGDWFFYTYEAGRLAAELARHGVTANDGVVRMRFSALPPRPRPW